MSDTIRCSAQSFISARKLTVHLGSQTILNEVDLDIQKGECVVLIGPSGQGKSVLLKTLAGLIVPTRGSVVVEGHNLHGVAGQERRDLLRRMGVLFQKNALFDSLTAADNIAFPLREFFDLSSAEIRERVNQFLDAVGLAGAQKLFPEEMSGGMQKRLGIARALALGPEIVFYDDPTAGLDPITSRKIASLIQDLQEKQQATLIVITNDMNRAFQLGTRLVYVGDQKLTVTGNRKQTLENRDPRVYQFIRGELDGPLTRH